MVIISIILIIMIIHVKLIIMFTSQCIAGWLDSVSSRVVYELDYKKLILYVIPIDSILGKLPVVPVGDTGTIPHRLRNHFEGAPGDRREGSGDGCRVWFVNSSGPAICNESHWTRHNGLHGTSIISLMAITSIISICMI